MTLPRPLGTLPRYLNPVVRPLASYLPPMALLGHCGRRSGREYQTPVQAYRTPQGYIAAFLYSDNPEWARNLLAAGTGRMTRAGKHYTIANLRRLGPDGVALLPSPVAAMMRAIAVTGVLQFDAEPSH